MYSGGIMRTRITLIVGLSTIFLFLSIYGTPYVNGQSSTLNSSSVDNETSSTNSKTENLDPFVLKGSSNTANTGNSNDPAQADDGSSANSNNDDSDKDGSDDDKSSKGDKNSDSKDDKKFELPFP